MRILIVTNDVTVFNGWGVIGAEYGRTLREMGHEIEYFTKAGGNKFDPSITTWPFLFYRRVIPRTLLYFLFHAIVINCLHLFRRYDAVIIVIEPLMPLAPYLLIKKKIQVLAGTYSVLPWLDSSLAKLYRKALHRIDGFTSISEYTREKFLHYSGSAPDKVVTLPLGVHPQPDVKLPEFREPAFMFVGANKERKGLFYALQADVQQIPPKALLKTL